MIQVTGAFGRLIKYHDTLDIDGVQYMVEPAECVS